jgi:peptidoglycan/LPS O-acetylase OafA/YrhL
MFALGLAIGLVSALATFALHRGSLPIGAIAVAGVAEMFMLPSPTWHYSPDIFPLNKPGWSLFFELVANAIYAFGWRFLSNKALAAIVLVSGVALIVLCTMGGGFGGAGWANIGWGLPRVCFSFFFGVLIGRRYDERYVESPLAAFLPLVIIPILFLPQLAGQVTELAMAMLVFPCIVIAGAVVEPRSARIYLLLGAISYPLYAIHEPLLYFCWRILLFFKLTPEQLAPAIGVAFAAFVVVLCLWLEKRYDIPARNYLTARFAKRRK